MSPREADSPPLTITSIGDAAVILRWGGRARVDPLRIAAVDRSIRAARLRGVVDIVPAPASVLVRFDPGRASVADLETPLRRLASARVARARARAHRLAVRYGGEDGPDVEEVAERLRLQPGQVVARHQAVSYTVLATGLAPGFVYLGPLPRSLRLPRRAEPRVAVPAGSVAIADAQTGVYGARTGGGWLADRPNPKSNLLARATIADGACHRRSRHIRGGRLMALEVLDPGPSTTVQDFGRPGHGACGVAEGGAMDRELLAAVNRAAGNRPRAAGLESPSKDRNCVGGAVAVSGSRSGLTRSGR